MAPKKKGNKKGDDWEADLGEAPAAAPVEAADAPAENAEADPEDEFPQGGLMAMMRKKQKKKKGGKQGGDEELEGEDPVAEDAAVDLAEKQPEEASIEDEFALPDKKGKGKAVVAKEVEEDGEERGADGKVMTKAQKEKAKKEREKQRKKENVSSDLVAFACISGC